MDPILVKQYGTQVTFSMLNHYTLDRGGVHFAEDIFKGILMLSF